MSEVRPTVVFVTGKLAAPALKPLVARLADEIGFEAEVVVARISVAALMTVDWLIGKFSVPPNASRVVLPGLCAGDLESLSRALGGVPVERGPKDFRDLSIYFRRPPDEPSDYGGWDIEILAEINHADQMPIDRLLAEAERFRTAGADVIDLGCTPGRDWKEIATATRDLVARGFRVSVDSFDSTEVARAAEAGAELALSVDASNRAAAREWGCQVVVIPDRHDQSDWFDSLRRSIDVLDRDGVPFRVDPILDPIGFGFARALGRYLETRDRLPDAEIMMGIGNLTELTDVDSAGVNAVLVGFCQELGVRSVLTTEVIPWARSSVREIAVARELMRFAVVQGVLPKALDDRLLMLRDRRVDHRGERELRQLQERIKDPNFRIFAEEGKITVFNDQRFERSEDPFDLFDRLGVTDPSHAFYLGWEMMKASVALRLGKRYDQDQALRWGLLTVEEGPHRGRRRGREGHRSGDAE